MPRRCPACQTVIDDDRLVACPNPECPSHFSGTAQTLPLTKDQIDQLATQLRGPVTWRILKSGWTWAGFFSLLLALFGVSYPTIRDKVEEMVTSQIAQRFAEPRIRETFQEVAENQASKMLRDEIQPAVDRFRADLQKEYQTVSEEIERLKLQSNLPLLSDKALNHDDREEFEEIIRIAKNAPENSPLKNSAIGEVRNFINIVGGPWIGNKFVSQSLLKSDSGLLKDDTKIPTDQIVVSLSDSDSKVKDRAAMLLGSRREKGVPDHLLQEARADKHLRVTYHALVSFGYITRRVGRPIAARQKPISQTQLIEMFDIDKLVQWWQEHSAEVNERLPDMK